MILLNYQTVPLLPYFLLIPHLSLRKNQVTINILLFRDFKRESIREEAHHATELSAVFGLIELFSGSLGFDKDKYWCYE